MSIVVDLSELGDALEAYPWCYLVTVSGTGRSHLLAVPTHFGDGVFTMTVGRTPLANVTTRPEVTLAFPGPGGADMSLIVDGTATIGDGSIEVTPTAAVLHRPAL